MSINIIAEHKTKAGRSEALIALMRTLLPESLQHGGAEEILIRQDQDNPSQRYLKFQDDGASRWVGYPRMVETRRVWRSE